MIIEMNAHVRHNIEYAETLTREQCLRARELMSKQFCDLLSHSPSENLYWLLSKTDLIDLAYEVYLTQSLKDTSGRPYDFKSIVKRACAVLHVPEPCNPYSMAFNARNRKGVRQKSFFSRFCWKMYTMKSSNPLHAAVRWGCEGM